MTNEELELAHNYACYTHRNIFLTGKAGTGKTTFLRRLSMETHKRKVVVAPTGVAAINAGGSTIHSFFQLAPGLYLPDGQVVGGRETRSRFAISRHKLNIIRSLDLLVIDEISMVRADLLDAVSDALCRIRHNDSPFGGVQLLLIGDLQQLAPVTTDDEWVVLQHYYDTPYFFSSHALQQTDFTYIELKKVYRQEDQQFVDLLNRVRSGKLDPPAVATLNSRYMPAFQPPDGEDWITLVTHNYQARHLNEQHMAALPSPSVTFQARVSGEFPQMSYPTEERLELKVGAQVMFCKNDPSAAKAYFNGKIGRVEELKDDSVTVVCRQTDTSGEGGHWERITVGMLTWENTRYVSEVGTGQIKEERIGTFTQIPLRTAWAITIHKSQGLTFDHAIINAGRAFSYGQVYVALSRCRTMEGLILSTPITSDLITVDPEVIYFGEEALSRIPTPATFSRDRRMFIEELLCSIFDFRAISMRLRSYVRFASEYTGYLFPAYSQAAAACASQLDAQLFSVGVRFQQQIRSLMPLSESYDDNQVLQERISKGLEYYCRETPRILGEFMEMDRPDTDNKNYAEVLSREYELLQAAYTEKMAIFVACLPGFSLDRYWDAKAKASMAQSDMPSGKSTGRKTPGSRRRKAECSTVDDSSRRKGGRAAKSEVDYSSIRNQELYNAIRSWRKEVARERHLPDGYILQLKAVIGITNLQPKNLDELMSVPGVGAIIVKEYGTQLLNLVAAHGK